MHQQNNQITEKRQFLFSLIHANTKYDFIGSWKITHTPLSSLYLCLIYPLNINAQFIRIDTQSLKIQLNRLLLQSNPHLSSTGFKFKLHPIKGIFFLQCSYLSNIQSKKQQQLQNFQDQIIFQLINSQTIKTIISKIINLKDSGSIFPNKQKFFPQILKFTYNSSFYGFVSSKDEKSTKFSRGDMCVKQNTKAEIWSDCSSQLEQQLSDKQNQTEQSFTNNIFSKKEQKNQNFSDFYRHYRSEYEKMSPFVENKIRNYNMFNEQGCEEGKLVVKYFMSQQDDLQLYRKYLMKHVQTTPESSEKQIINSKFMEKQMSRQGGIFMLYNNIYKQKPNKSTQPEEQQSNLTTFLESNRLTLLKSSKWRILIEIISKVYEDFIQNRFQQKRVYLDMRVYYIKRNLQATFKQKHNQIIHLLRLPMQKTQQQPASFINQYEQFQEIIQKQEFIQKNIAEIMLNIACFICIPEVKFISRRFNKAFQLFNNRKERRWDEKLLRRQLSMEGQYSKFKSTNTQVESILLYLQQRAMKFNKAPFADWIMIMCECINSALQENEVIVG